MSRYICTFQRPIHQPLHPPLTMCPFSSCILIAKLAEATGVPYLENLAKAAIAVIELLEVCMPVPVSPADTHPALLHRKSNLTKTESRNLLRALSTQSTSSRVIMLRAGKERKELNIWQTSAGRWSGGCKIYRSEQHPLIKTQVSR